MTSETKVVHAQNKIFVLLEPDQKKFLEFVLTKYIESGVEEMDQENFLVYLS
ncbi:MAG: hypothetical protein ABJB16_02140 [Saprospiraceae bacterium]